ncbi:MAG: hypothetical protein U9M92_00165 [Patescibacteria group bacterium]|nr:hypothetical protein [Patescibacteria group bacterium]
MVLSTHAVTGAAVASLVPANPVLGFALAFASHFVLDAIPHWEYHLSSTQVPRGGDQLEKYVKIGPAFLGDLMKTGADFFLGALLALLLFYPASGIDLRALLLGVIGGVLPDFFQFVFWRWRPFWLNHLQRLHHWAHAKKGLDNSPLIGVLSQVAVIIVVYIVLR